MQYNFQEGLLCGLLMTHDSGSYNPNKDYKPLNDPLFNYILENYTPKIEIIMTPHYTYKYYFDVTPFYSNDDILLWKDFAHSGFYIRKDSRAHEYQGPYGYMQGINLHNFYKAINCQTFNVFEMNVWYRDDKPIIGHLDTGQTIAKNSPDFHEKYKIVDEETVWLGTICYPEYAIKDMTITQSAPLGIFEQPYYVSKGKIHKDRITLPEGAAYRPTISITYNQGINRCHPSNYDLMEYDPETGRPLPTNPPDDWSEDPIIFPSGFEQKTYTLDGTSMLEAPDFSISTTGINRVFCEMSSDEFHECELELINQQYEVAKCGYLKVRDIPNFLLPKGFTNKDLPPELNRTLPTT